MNEAHPQAILLGLGWSFMERSIRFTESYEHAH